MPADSPMMGYYRCLLVVTKKVELELANYTDNLNRLWNDLEEVHDFIHETFPKE